MDEFGASQPPAAYREVERIDNILVALIGVGWGINYVMTAYTSFRDNTYCAPLLSICQNLAWEVIYTLIYPPDDRVEWVVYFGGMLTDIVVVYSAVVNARREWSHAPLVADNIPLISVLAILFLFSGHLALAWEIGPFLGYWWSAAFCQIVLGFSHIALLLTRGSRRGGSYVFWIGRYFGTACGVTVAWIRCKYWPEAYGWMGGPLGQWTVAAFVTLDAVYGVAFWQIDRLSAQSEKRKTT